MNILAGISRGAAVLGSLQSLLPLVGALVQSAESLFPASGAGAQKFAHVLDVVKNTLTLAGTAVTEVEAQAPAIGAAIEAVVSAAKGKVIQNPQTGQWVAAPPAAA